MHLNTDFNWWHLTFFFCRWIILSSSILFCIWTHRISMFYHYLVSSQPSHNIRARQCIFNNYAYCNQIYAILTSPFSLCLFWTLSESNYFFPQSFNFFVLTASEHKYSPSIFQLPASPNDICLKQAPQIWWSNGWSS